jgi:exodeoxyribonuclease V alpha subunit
LTSQTAEDSQVARPASPGPGEVSGHSEQDAPRPGEQCKRSHTQLEAGLGGSLLGEAAASCTSAAEDVRSWPGWRAIDRQLANVLLREVESDSIELWLTVALLSFVTEKGDVCIELTKVAERELADVLRHVGRETENVPVPAARFPALSKWRGLLEGSGLVAAAGGRCPLVLAGNRLYLSRYFDHEVALAGRIRQRLVPVRSRLRIELARPLLERWFDGVGERVKLAAAIAVARRFCVLTGGPGTGKTSAVVRILGLLNDLAQSSEGKALRVLLLAPTGKAASRLTESIVRAKERLTQLSSTILSLPSETSTVHRAIGECRRSPDGERIPFDADIVVLDEASMIDMATMRRLMDVSVNVERFVVLGDPHQLASVEAGAVLGEICVSRSAGYAGELADVIQQLSGVAVPARDGATELSDHVVELTESHRFRADGGIGLLARRINAGDASGALAVLEGRDAEVGFIDVSRQSIESVERLVLRGNSALMTAGSPAEALLRLERFRVLCAHRKGRFGVETWNARMQRHAEASQRRVRDRSEILPILIGVNSVDLPLRNGDLGIIWREASRTRAWFGLADGTTAGYGLSRLPAYEAAYAMSIHKCQGSEMDEIVVLLPDADSPLLTRELLYTAVTRAKKRCTVVGTREAVRAAVVRRVERRSGLAEVLAAAPYDAGRNRGAAS